MQDKYKTFRILLWATAILNNGARAWLTAFAPLRRTSFGQKNQRSYGSARLPFFNRHTGFPPYESFTSTNHLLRMAAAPNNIEFETDPFKVLQMEPTADKKQIKRAYKRMALKYHPDMVTNKDSTAQERKAAGDRFAKINWAYENLTGKGSGASSSSWTSSNSQSRSTSSSSSGWEPPHRRKNSYGKSAAGPTASDSSSSPSTDWRDYIPNGGYNDDSQYDTGGDSFGQIFADLLTGAAGAAASGGTSGIFKDFVEFLENNVDGMGTGYNAGDDADLTILLRSGSAKAVGEEMDDTELLVNQLDTKSRKLQDEVWTLQAELRQVTRFSEQITLKEEIEELQARQDVVKGYQRKARKRLVALQNRYKELIVSDRSADRQETYHRYRNEPETYAPKNPSSSSSRRGTTTSSSSTDGTRNDTKENAWEGEGFGSFSRRGSARGRSRRSRSSSSNKATGDPSSYSSKRYTSARSYESASSSDAWNDADSSSTASSNRRRNGSSSFSTEPSSPNRTPTVPSTQAQDVNVPPHRRTSSVADDKRRLRDLKVDEEFDKLKRELGL